jgi:hypothetical protein
MTEPSPKPVAERRVARVPEIGLTTVGASALFLGALGGLGVQMAAGHDPALGPAKPVAGAAAPGPADAKAVPGRVVEKRILRRVIVTRVVTDPAPVTGPSAAAAAGAPVVRTSAPGAAAATSAPAAAPGAAPAPAPPPVQTSSS